MGQLTNRSDVEKYIGKDTDLWAVLPSYGLTSDALHKVNIVNGSAIKDFDPDKQFAFTFVGSYGYRTGDFDKEYLFESLEEAKDYLQELVNNIEVCETPAGDTVGIYKGGIVSGLVQLDNEQFDWKDYGDYQGILNRGICLSEIYKQAVAKGLIGENDTLTVFETSPLRGEIYVCGNYSAGDWVSIGKTKGYA